MARLGLNINIDAQRLLAANKERAASNRAALEERKNREKIATDRVEASAKDRAEQQDDRSSVPDLYRPDEPAAQRRKKGVEVYGVDNINSFAVAGTVQKDSISFNGYAATWKWNESREVNLYVFGLPYTLEYYNVVPVPLTNFYSTQETRWRPAFNQELKNNRRFYLGDAYTINNDLTGLDWTFSHRSQVNGVPGATPSVATPPTLPFLLEDKVVVDQNAFPYPARADSPWTKDGTVLTRSDGKFIYHSRLVIYSVPTAEFFYGSSPAKSIYDPNDFETTGQRYTTSSGTYFFERTRRSVVPVRDETPIFLDGSGVFYFQALYWRFDVATKKTTFSTSLLGTVQGEFRGNIIPSRYSDALKIVGLWFDGMHLGDPSRRLWKTYSANYPTLFDFVYEDFLSNPNGFLLRWPAGLSYNEKTGMLTIVTGLKGVSTPRIFSKDIGKNVNDFSTIPVVHLPAGYNKFLTTEQDFIGKGWKAEGLLPQTTLAPLEQYFAFKR